MSNEIITMNALTIAEKLTFKNEALSKATSEILSIYNDAMTYADAKNRQIASILARVKSERSYTEDGFTSVADYASKTFGIKKQNAYALANAGEIYNDETASEKLKAFTPSKLAEITNVPRETLESAVESGRITATTTQKDLRDYAKLAAPVKDTKTDIVDTYEARPLTVCMALPEAFTEVFKMGPLTIDEWSEVITGAINENGRFPAEVIKLPKAPMLIKGELGNKKVVERRLYITHDFSLSVEFTTHKRNMELEKKPKAPKMTREDLLALLAEMDEAEANIDNEPDETGDYSVEEV